MQPSHTQSKVQSTTYYYDDDYMTCDNETDNYELGLLIWPPGAIRVIGL